jgi:hypothetical protein
MIFSFTLTDANTLTAYAIIFFFHLKLALVPASPLMSPAGIVYNSHKTLLAREGLFLFP